MKGGKRELGRKEGRKKRRRMEGKKKRRKEGGVWNIVGEESRRGINEIAKEQEERGKESNTGKGSSSPLGGLCCTPHPLYDPHHPCTQARDCICVQRKWS